MIPVYSLVGGPVRVGNLADSFFYLNSRGLAKAVIIGVLADVVDSHNASYLIEKDVAGITESVADVDPSVVTKAGRLIVREIGVNVFAIYGGGRFDVSKLKSGRCNDRFKGGTGGVSSLRGSVEKRVIIRCEKLGIIPVIGGKVIGRIVCRRKNFAGSDFYNNRHAAFGFFTFSGFGGVSKVKDLSFKGVVSNSLKVHIYCGNNGCAGNSFLDYLFAYDIAVCVIGYLDFSVFSFKNAFISGFKTAFSDDIVHSVNGFVKVCVFLFINNAGDSDNVGRNVPVGIFALITFGNFDSLKIIAVFADYVYGGFGNVLREGVRRNVVIADPVHLIANAGNLAEILVAHFLKAIFFLKAENNVIRGSKIRKAEMFSEPCLGVFGSLINKGSFFGKRKVIYPFLAVFFKNGNKFKNNGVFAVFKNVVFVEGYVIANAVCRKKTSVTVNNVPAGSFNGFRNGITFRKIRTVRFALDNLHGHKADEENRRDQNDKKNNSVLAPFCNIKFFVVGQFCASFLKNLKNHQTLVVSGSNFPCNQRKSRQKGKEKSEVKTTWGPSLV